MNITSSTITGSSQTTRNPTNIINIQKSGIVTLTGKNNRLFFTRIDVEGTFLVIGTPVIHSINDENNDLSNTLLSLHSNIRIAIATPANIQPEITLHISTINVRNEGIATLRNSSGSTLLQMGDETSVIRVLQGGILEIEPDNPIPITTNDITINDDINTNTSTTTTTAPTTIVPQTIIIPISISQGGKLVTNSTNTSTAFVHQQKNLEVFGNMDLIKNSQMIIGGDSSTFASTSITNIYDTCTLYIDGKNIRWFGKINDETKQTGSMVIQTSIEFTNSIYLGEIFMIGDILSIGSSTIQSPHSPNITVSHTLYFDSGKIIGAGIGPTRSITVTKNGIFTIDGNTINKQLNRVMVDLRESTMEIINSAIVDFSNNTYIRLSPLSTAVIYSGSNITQSTPNELSMFILGEDSTVIFRTSTIDPINFDIEIRGNNEYGTVNIYLPQNVYLTNNTSSSITDKQSIIFTKPITSKYFNIQSPTTPNISNTNTFTTLHQVDSTLNTIITSDDNGEDITTVNTNPSYTRLLLNRMNTINHGTITTLQSTGDKSTVSPNRPFYTYLQQQLLPIFQGKTLHLIQSDTTTNTIFEINFQCNIRTNNNDNNIQQNQSRSFIPTNIQGYPHISMRLENCNIIIPKDSIWNIGNVILLDSIITSNTISNITIYNLLTIGSETGRKGILQCPNNTITTHQQLYYSGSIQVKKLFLGPGGTEIVSPYEKILNVENMELCTSCHMIVHSDTSIQFTNPNTLFNVLPNSQLILSPRSKMLLNTTTTTTTNSSNIILQNSTLIIYPDDTLISQYTDEYLDPSTYNWFNNIDTNISPITDQVIEFQDNINNEIEQRKNNSCIIQMSIHNHGGEIIMLPNTTAILRNGIKTEGNSNITHSNQPPIIMYPQSYIIFDSISPNITSTIGTVFGPSAKFILERGTYVFKDSVQIQQLITRPGANAILHNLSALLLDKSSDTNDNTNNLGFNQNQLTSINAINGNLNDNFGVAPAVEITIISIAVISSILCISLATFVYILRRNHQQKVDQLTNQLYVPSVNITGHS